MVQQAHRGDRGARDQRAGVGGLRVLSRLPDSGDGEGHSLALANVERELAPTYLLPLVESVREKEASSLAEGGGEGALVRHRFGARHDEPRGSSRVLALGGERRNQAPP